MTLNAKLKKNDSKNRTEKDDSECRNWEEIVALNAKR